MIQIGIRAHDMEMGYIEEMVKNMKVKGLNCTQLALSKAITYFNTNIEAMTPGLAMYLKRVFLKNDVDVSVLGCYLNLGTPDEKELKNNQEIYKHHIIFASILGAGMVGTETGAVNTEYKYEDENKSEKSLEIFINNLRPVIEFAEKMGVLVAIEPVASHIVYNIERARKVIDEINSPNLKIIFDPVNLITKDNYELQHEIIRDAFDLLGEHIACIHAKDFIINSDKTLSHVIAGDGLLDYNYLFEFVKKYKPYIQVLLEDTKPENVYNAIEYIEKIYEKC